MGAVALEPTEVDVAHHEQHVELVGRREQPPSHEHLGQHHADREQVGLRAHSLAEHLLRRHVAVLALERAGLGLLLDRGGVGDAEVDQLHVAAPRHQDVGRRDVAVDQAERITRVVGQPVRVVEAVEDLLDDVGGDLGRQPDAAVGALAQHGEHIETVDVLHLDVELALLAAEPVGLGDPRVRQPGGDLRLGDEHCREVRVGRQVGQDSLDHHLLGEPVVAADLAEVELGHAPDGEPLDKLVAPERYGKGGAHSPDQNNTPDFQARRPGGGYERTRRYPLSASARSTARSKWSSKVSAAPVALDTPRQGGSASGGTPTAMT